MPVSLRLAAALCASLVAVVLGGAAPALAAGRPGAVALRAAASSARQGAVAANAVDGRRATAWRAAHRGPWWLRVTLRRPTRVAALKLIGAGAPVRLRIQVSPNGRHWRRAGTTHLVPGRARSIDLGGATVRGLRLQSIGRSARPAGVAELQVVAVRTATSSARPQTTKTTKPSTTTATTSTATTSGAADPTGPAPDPTPVGAPFAGVVRDPIDPNFLSCLPFGKRSHWVQPWRAYLDTWPASRLKSAAGINFNTTVAQAPATARLLADSGFSRARIEIGWGDLSYDDQSRLRDQQGWMTKLQALHDNGIRPLFLLNANDWRPVPLKDLSLQVLLPAVAGTRTVQLDAASAAQVKPGYTGFNYNKYAEYLITSVSPTGLATLARPLPVSISPGAYPASTLAYKPFSPLTRPDGSANPDGEATMAGWLRYVQTITDLGKQVFGAGGFDLEVWNEMNFGSDFLDINNYYDPDVYSTKISDDTIMRRTVSWVKDPARGLGGVRIGNGFANQRPWDGGDSGPVGLDAIDRHFYPRNLRFPVDTVNNQLKDAQCNIASMNYDPAYTAFFPEFWLTGIATETMVRDLAPQVEAIRNPDGTTSHHGRFVAPSGGTPPQVWMTEFGLDTSWARNQPGSTINAADEQYLRAKSTLRALTAFVNKGVTQLDFYATTGADWGLVDPGFFSSLAATGAYPGDAAGGQTMTAVRRLLGALGNDPITVPRKLTLASIGDYSGQWQFTGLNTTSYPTLYDRDVLAFFPFQASDTRFVVPVYVMTRDLSKVYRPDLAGDPHRFDMPAERYQLTIGGTHSATAQVHALDPMTGQSVPVSIVRRDPNGWLSVEMPVTDSPRLLIIDG